MAHPQSSPRGLFAKSRIDVGSQQLTYNSTGLKLSGGLLLSGKSVTLTANTTGVISSGSFLPSAAAGGAITADSTGVILSAIKIGAHSTAITVDSTGILIGSSYISTNSTGN